MGTSDAKVWAAVPVPNGAHVVPLNDDIEHVLDDTCLCGPTDEPQPRPDGSVGWLTTHHSLDGREATETPVRKGSL